MCFSFASHEIQNGCRMRREERETKGGEGMEGGGRKGRGGRGLDKVTTAERNAGSLLCRSFRTGSPTFPSALILKNKKE